MLVSYLSNFTGRSRTTYGMTSSGNASLVTSSWSSARLSWYRDDLSVTADAAFVSFSLLGGFVSVKPDHIISSGHFHVSCNER